MITPQELRVGNTVMVRENYEGGRWIQCDYVMAVTILGLAKCEIECKGIPLTSEWLVRFGFLKEEGQCEIYNITVIPSGRIKLNIFKWSEGWGVAFSDHYLPQEKTIENFKNIEFVHQLQNLFYALTGKELILDSKPDISTSSTAPDSTSAK